MRLLALTILALLVAGLAGCTGSKDDLVRNDCTNHPQFGTGNPRVTLQTTMGNMTLEIFVDKVPNTGMNFVKLAEDGSFDGSPFHRIITNFMTQGGDYTLGNGRGGEAHPDCADANGNIQDEYRADLKHDIKGTISMANTGQLNSGSSQFFITFGPTPHLDAYDAQGNKKSCGQQFVSCHAVFGKVVDGIPTLDRINAEAGSQNGAPRVPVTLTAATVAWP